VRHDLFQDRKCVHVKLEKETHAALRSELFQQGISMQEAFDEFALQLVEGGRSARAIVDTLVTRKLREAIDGRISKRKKRNQGFGELDSESLYSLINGDLSKDRGEESIGND